MGSLSCSEPGAGWRLLLDGKGAGSLNMAVDEALARSCAAAGPPTLRFYDWSLPTLSVGRHQRLLEAADPAACARLGIDLVRRPSGGRAVLHETEITYAAALPRAEVSRLGGLRCAVAALARAVVEGLLLLGVPARAGVEAMAPAAPEDGRTPACFFSAAAGEVLAGGYKVAAASQCRFAGALLQHGSIPLRAAAERIRMVTGGAAPPSAGLEPRGLEPWIGAGVGREEIQGALARGFERVLGARFDIRSISQAEITLAQRLERETFANEAWTRRR